MSVAPKIDMDTRDILERSYQAQAIVSTCALALDGLAEGHAKPEAAAGDIALCLRAALDLFGPLHDAMERHDRKPS